MKVRTDWLYFFFSFLLLHLTMKHKTPVCGPQGFWLTRLHSGLGSSMGERHLGAPCDRPGFAVPVQQHLGC